MGRPKKITGQHIAQIEKLAGLGLTQASIAAVIGCAPSTLRSYKGQDGSDVSGALERGKAVAEAAVGEALYTKAVGGCIQSIRWWEMTRANRSEKSQVSTDAASYGVLICPPRAASPEAWTAGFSKPTDTEGDA